VDKSHNFYVKVFPTRSPTMTPTNILSQLLTSYRQVLGVRHGKPHRNIGPCGRFTTREMIQAECTKYRKCVGYSTRRYKSTHPRAVAENGFYPWCLKAADTGRTVDKSHNFYVKVFPTRSPTMTPTNILTQLPTPSPTVLLTTAPTRSCNEKQIWTKKIALDNCPAKNYYKTFGVYACRSSYQERLVLSLANKLYKVCRSRCVYDYDTIIAGGLGAFRYKRRLKCYRYVTKGRCFTKKKKQYKAALKRAKELC